MSEEHPERRPAGELEASVLAVLWAAGDPLTPADVQRTLGSGLARTTVTTILSRLHDKGWVTRSREGRGFAYTPTEDSPGSPPAGCTPSWRRSRTAPRCSPVSSPG